MRMINHTFVDTTNTYVELAVANVFAAILAILVAPGRRTPALTAECMGGW